MTKCNICKKEYTILCDYNQGRCPYHPPQINVYSVRFAKLLDLIKQIFKFKK